MFKRLAVFFCATLAIVLSSCSAAPTSGLKSYADAYDGYEFLYPNGWTEIDASKIAPDVIFHDLIESSENVSVIINPIGGTQSIDELGTPSEVGNKLAKTAIAPPESGRQAELTNVATRTDDKNHTYYLFEYAVTLPEGVERHNLASAVIARDQLFTLNVSTPERRWAKDGEQLKIVAQSFSVY